MKHTIGMRKRIFEVDKGILKYVLKQEFEKSFISTLELIFSNKILPTVQQEKEMEILSYRQYRS